MNLRFPVGRFPTAAASHIEAMPLPTSAAMAVWLAGGALAARLAGAALAETKATLVLDAPPTPVVLWHGMGDVSDDPMSMGKLKQAIEQEIPGVFVYSIRIGADDAADREAGFVGRVDEQVKGVCDVLARVPELKGGFHAVGFSQGGQFLRAYVQRCNAPPVKTLVTMGGQHMGVSNLPGCLGAGLTCRTVRALLELGAYNPAVQSRVVQAQYFRDVAQYDTYLKRSDFLADINNERLAKNATYKENLLSLDRLVLYMFEKDTTVVPRISSWFSSLSQPCLPNARRAAHACCACTFIALTRHPLPLHTRRHPRRRAERVQHAVQDGA